MHAALYAGWAILLIVIFNRPLSRGTVLLVLTATLLIGILQEGIQLLSAVQIFNWNSAFDLGVDLIGAGIGIAMLWGIKKVSGLRNTPET